MNQEIINIDFQHGFVFNMVSIHFNEKTCQKMLAEEISNDSKRELLHAAYLYYFNQSTSLKSKTNYGDSNISFASSINNIKNYIDEINKKLYNQITKEEFEEHTLIIEQALEITDKEQEVSSNIVIPHIKQNIGINY